MPSLPIDRRARHQFITARLMLRIPDAEVVRELIAEGSAPDFARREVARARVAVDRAIRHFAIETEKLSWLYGVSAKLRALHQAPGTIARMQTIGAQAFLHDFYSRNQPLVLTNITDNWPPIKSLVACAPTLYGTWRMSTRAMVLNNSPDRWFDVPLPPVP